MTKDEPLLVKTETGYEWGRWHGSRRSAVQCLVARALGVAVGFPTDEAERTRLGRRLHWWEAASIRRVDTHCGTERDRKRVLRLAAVMGVEP